MGNNILRCRKCKTKFEVNGVVGQLCPRCLATEEETYQKVRAYIKERPGVGIDEVSEVLKVPRVKIMSYIREERIEIINKDVTLLKCKNCGKAISSGLFCGDCKKHTDERIKQNTKSKSAKIEEAYPGESIRYDN